jgi:hypothetical protein
MGDRKKQEEDSELRPTSSPPEDVEIPTESIYGDNTPMEPIEDEPEPPKPAATGKPKVEAPESSGGKSIRIGFLPFLFLLGILGAGLFIAGQKLGGNLQSNPIKENDGTTSKTEEKQKKTINFIADKGIYKKDNDYDASKLAELRLGRAKKTILWVTGEPNNPKILSLLEEVKENEGLPIIIVTGSETEKERIKPARKAGFVVNQTQDALEIPYSFLIIDSKLLMDISRDNWVWETTDKTILNEASEWLEEITKTAKIVK